ncbi:pseudouridine synthase [Gonapodya prolifera JEL478]|uniref:Pseudouridine synthase n=1 Tax=Gonapodya prolifera (strain JEL478) TaxID=1344416 RepID=A0A139A455_GONPJ|nr:pseudouridine synthase [Gonapodya prolifera JEL478]|eukprot:KXS11255.1 pseudouridine synthase [Gonapodya prolifera JEL478]
MSEPTLSDFPQPECSLQPSNADSHLHPPASRLPKSARRIIARERRKGARVRDREDPAAGSGVDGPVLVHPSLYPTASCRTIDWRELRRRLFATGKNGLKDMWEELAEDPDAGTRWLNATANSDEFPASIPLREVRIKLLYWDSNFVVVDKPWDLPLDEPVRHYNRNRVKDIEHNTQSTSQSDPNNTSRSPQLDATSPSTTEPPEPDATAPSLFPPPIDETVPSPTPVDSDSLHTPYYLRPNEHDLITTNVFIHPAFPNRLSTREVAKLRPVHQLDAATSGVHMWAVGARSAGMASKQFQYRRARKSYLVLVRGQVDFSSFTSGGYSGDNTPGFDTHEATAISASEPDGGTASPPGHPEIRVTVVSTDPPRVRVDAAIADVEETTKRMKIGARGEGRDAVTEFEILRTGHVTLPAPPPTFVEAAGRGSAPTSPHAPTAPHGSRSVPCTLLRAHPITGRRHQIRLHAAAALGCPVLGDIVYDVVSPSSPLHEGTPAEDSPASRSSWEAYAAPRMCLHAASLAIPLPPDWVPPGADMVGGGMSVEDSGDGWWVTWTAKAEFEYWLVERPGKH